MEETNLPFLISHLCDALQPSPREIRRLFHGRGRCYPGLEQISVDWFQGVVLVSLFKEPSEEFLTALYSCLNALTQRTVWQESLSTSLLLQHRDRPGAPTECLWGEERSHIIGQENGLHFEIHFGRNQNNGLFLDMRYGRSWVKNHSQDKRILNLFAYTCAFSVAAIAGGADTVVNLDMAKGALNRGRENHRLNNHDLDKVKFFAHDIFKSWGKIKKYGPYDMIIIDPPTFQRGSFALSKDYPKILRRLPELLTNKGEVLACVNDPGLSPAFLIEGMKTEAPDLMFQQRLENPPEFTDANPEGGLKVLLFQKIS